jgi:hypothetical protein
MRSVTIVPCARIHREERLPLFIYGHRARPVFSTRARGTTVTIARLAAKQRTGKRDERNPTQSFAFLHATEQSGRAQTPHVFARPKSSAQCQREETIEAASE